MLSIKLIFFTLTFELPCESQWTPGVGDGHGGLAFCDSWGRKESDTTEQLNWTDAPTIDAKEAEGDLF